MVRSVGFGWLATVCWLVWRLLHCVMDDWFHKFAPAMNVVLSFNKNLPTVSDDVS
jgi:thiosulfate reductase cytochrome b subunit